MPWRRPGYCSGNPLTSLRNTSTAAAAIALAALLLTPQFGLGEEATHKPADHCSCLWQGSFTEIVERSDFVVLAEVTRIRGNSADLAVEESFAGPDWHEEIRVWFRAHNYCRPDVSGFPTGSRWVLALQSIGEPPDDGFNPSTPNISFGRPGDWQLSSCGGYFLQVSGNTVRGNLVPGTTRWDQQPDMNPVLLDLLRSYLAGDAGVESLKRAAEEDPEVRELMLNTRSFLRGQEGLLPEQEPPQEDGP